MFKSTYEFGQAMVQILRQLCDEIDLLELSSPENESDRDAAIVECINKGYISGVTYDYTQDGKAHFCIGDLRVTYSGLSFMESF